MFLFKTLFLITTTKIIWIKKKVEPKPMKRTRFDTHEERNDPVETKGHSQVLSNYLHSQDTVIKKAELRHMDWGECEALPARII